MTIVEDLFQPGVAPIVGATIGAIVAINGLFVRWIQNSFNRLETALVRIADSTATRTEMTVAALDKHEDHDQARHEENLYRFEKISVALAKLGAENGTH